MITLAVTAIPSTIYDRSTSPEIRINIQLSKHVSLSFPIV